jgi:hypothetical protein
MTKTFESFMERKVDEGNAFTAALQKAKDEGLEEFEFNGKTYKVNEGLHESEDLTPPSKLKTFE